LDGTSEWVPAGSTGANAVTFSDTGLQQNTLYYYRVYAYQTTLNSPYSNIAKAKTTESTQVLLEFAQIAVGGTWRSFLFLTNPTDAPIKSKVEFFQDNGQPLVVDINGRTSSSLDIMVVPDASLKLDLLGTTRTVQVGWCRVTAEGNLGGMLIYQLMNGNNVDSQATVLPSLRLRKFRIPLTYLRERTDVGLAIANPMNRPTQIAMQYFSLDGSSSIAGAPFLLDSMNHVARFFGEFLQNLPDNAQGVVEVLSDGDVIAVGLAFIKNSVFTTIPVIPVP
jgi:hypothetical protein